MTAYDVILFIYMTVGLFWCTYIHKEVIDILKNLNSFQNEMMSVLKTNAGDLDKFEKRLVAREKKGGVDEPR